MEVVTLPADLLRDIAHDRGAVSLVLQDHWRYGGSYQFYRNRCPIKQSGKTAIKTVGKRKEPPVTFSASTKQLVAGASFNDEIHRLPTGNTTYISKGVFRFKTHEEANRQQLDCLVLGMAKMASERS